jgi:hypothetical protein
MVAQVQNAWDRKPCVSKNPIQHAVRVLEQDTTVAIQDRVPKHAIGRVVHGKRIRKIKCQPQQPQQMFTHRYQM